MKFYATGNSGSGTRALAFSTKKERDEYVSFGSDDCRRAIAMEDVLKHYKGRAEWRGDFDDYCHSEGIVYLKGPLKND